MSARVINPCVFLTPLLSLLIVWYLSLSLSRVYGPRASGPSCKAATCNSMRCAVGAVACCAPAARPVKQCAAPPPQPAPPRPMPPRPAPLRPTPLRPAPTLPTGSLLTCCPAYATDSASARPSCVLEQCADDELKARLVVLRAHRKMTFRTIRIAPANTDYSEGAREAKQSTMSCRCGTEADRATSNHAERTSREALQQLNEAVSAAEAVSATDETVFSIAGAVSMAAETVSATAEAASEAAEAPRATVGATSAAPQAALAADGPTSPASATTSAAAEATSTAADRVCATAEATAEAAC